MRKRHMGLAALAAALAAAAAAYMAASNAVNKMLFHMYWEGQKQSRGEGI